MSLNLDVVLIKQLRVLLFVQQALSNKNNNKIITQHNTVNRFRDLNDGFFY